MPETNFGVTPVPEEGFVRLPVVLAMFAIGKSKAWEMVKQGKLPAPKKLGARTTVWDVQELREFQKRISEQGAI